MIDEITKSFIVFTEELNNRNIEYTTVNTTNGGIVRAFMQNEIWVVEFDKNTEIVLTCYKRNRKKCDKSELSKWFGEAVVDKIRLRSDQ